VSVPCCVYVRWAKRHVKTAQDWATSRARRDGDVAEVGRLDTDWTRRAPHTGQINRVWVGGDRGTRPLRGAYPVACACGRDQLYQVRCTSCTRCTAAVRGSSRSEPEATGCLHGRGIGTTNSCGGHDQQYIATDDVGNACTTG